MNWNDHSALKDEHAFLSPSKYHWVNYDEEKIENVYLSWMAVQKGTQLHELASKLIDFRQKLPKTSKTLNLFVNDGIGFKMLTEQTLFYSINCFGTADAISFRDNILRIHDLKTGQTVASMKQLEIYAALFCLEYNKNPTDIDIELRLYQLDEVLVHHPEPEEILYIMEKIKDFDKRIERLKDKE
jgi:hypothetical protein